VHNVQIGLAGVVGVYATLHAHLGGTALPGFDAARRDILRADIVGPATQVFALLTLGKRTELAFEIADVGVIDIAIDDIAHRVAVDRLAQLVGLRHHVREVQPARVEQACDIRFRQLAARATATDDSAYISGYRDRWRHGSQQLRVNSGYRVLLA